MFINVLSYLGNRNVYILVYFILIYLKMIIKKSCSFCNKEIDGFSERHANYLLSMHILGKHPDMIKIRKG